MTSTHCPVLTGDPAVGLVESAHYRFQNLATQAYTEAIQQANAASQIIIEPIDFNVSFDFQGQLAGFDRPEKPELNEEDFALAVIELPGDPAEFSAETPVLEPTPVFNIQAPSLSFGTRPAQPNIVAPTPPPRPGPLVFPLEPGFTLPEVPTFEALQMPTLPTINLPTFTATRPEFVMPNINDSWAFNPSAYVSELQAVLVAKVKSWLNGEAALPLAISRALFDRGRSRVEEETSIAVAQVYDEFAARGFSQPPGQLAARVDGVRQAGQNRIADFNREVAIKEFDEALANMRLALTQGIALEGLAVNIHLEQQRLLLASSTFGRETTLALLNARVAVFQALLAAYQADAQILESRIRAELAKVELFRAQIEGEKLRGEINEQKVRLYAEQIRAVNTLIALYQSRLEAVKIKAEAERGVIETYKGEVQAFGIRWDAYAKEWDGYKSSVEAENARVSVHRNLVDAYGIRVQAASTNNQSLVRLEELRIAEHGEQLKVYLAKLEAMRAQLENERARIAAVSTLADAQARIYTAEASVEQSATAATDRSFQLGLEREQAEVQTQLQVAQTRIQENISLTQTMLELHKLLTATAAQLAASAMSAVNASASVGSTRADNRGCSTNFQFSGEISDA